MIRATPARALFVLTALVATGCQSSAPSDESSSANSTPIRVRTVVVAEHPFVETLRATGTAIPRVGHVATLSAPAPTRVLRVFVAVGETVQAGAPLIALDRTAFEAASQSADVALRTASAAYERAQRLLAAGVIARKDVEAAQAALAQARANAVIAQRVHELGVLRAPMRGVVSQLNAVVGATADVSQPLVTVIDPSAIDVLFNVSPDEARRIKRGTAVALYSPNPAVRTTPASSGSLGHAVVAEIGASVDSATRAVTVRARITDPTPRIRAGETVIGMIALNTVPAAIAVPVDALVPEGDTALVYVVDRNGVAHARNVSVGPRNDQAVVITQGLVAGERVVTYGADGVADSAKVVEVRP
jgi:cobalt-zinc-cadmium efflux system membrane fusion protein